MHRFNYDFRMRSAKPIHLFALLASVLLLMACGSEKPSGEPTAEALQADVSRNWAAVQSGDANVLYEYLPKDVQKNCRKEVFAALASLGLTGLPERYRGATVEVADVSISGKEARYEVVYKKDGREVERNTVSAFFEDGRWKESGDYGDGQCGL